MHGQFVWYDLMTSDVEGAKRFYQPLGGWSTQIFDKSEPNNPYTMFVHGGSPIGGVMALSSQQRAMGIPPNWLPAVQVNNVDSTGRQAESLGGKVAVPTMDIPDTGRYAVIQDPQGAMLAIFTPKPGSSSDTAFDGTPRVGRVSWHELMTTDYKRAADFYRQLFGWEKVSEEDMGGGMMYYMYGMKGKMYGGMFNRPANMASVPPFWLPYIFVKDLKKSLADATKAGAKVVNGPMVVPGGSSIVVLSDPQGAAIALHQAAPAAKKAAKKAVKKVVRAAKKAVKKIARGARTLAKARPKKKKRAAAKNRRPKARSKKRRR